MRAGIVCHLHREDANTIPKETLEGNLQKGAEISARVKEIDFRTIRLILLSKSGDLADTERWEREYLALHDDWYYIMTEQERQVLERAKRVRCLPGMRPCCLCSSGWFAMPLLCTCCCQLLLW